MEHFNLQNKELVTKGNIGENIISSKLKEKGYVIYEADHEVSHPIDFIAIKDDVIRAIEIKTKPARKFYPDTGLDIKHWEKYLKVNEIIPSYIFFVDEILKKIYYNSIDELKIKKGIYPLKENNIIYFALNNMKILMNLDEEQVKQIKNYTKRNYLYE